MCKSIIFLVFLLAVFISSFDVSVRGPRHRSRMLSMDSAPFKRPRSANVAGNLYVDESCIDCDVCRWMCPNIFNRKGVKSAVYAQPVNEQQRLQAYAAMIACPVGSIRLYEPDSLTKSALDMFPVEIDPLRLPGIMHLGYHAPGSYGATPYFVKREQGNIMIDTPRFNQRLAKNIEDEGGLSLIILTHKDDVADHAKWQARFPSAQRVLHRTDVTKDTATVELQLEGEGQWQVAPDVLILHTPGKI